MMPMACQSPAWKTCNNVGMVLQNPTLFSGTIRENSLMGNPDAIDEDLIKAVDLSGAGQFIGMLPNGF